MKKGTKRKILYSFLGIIILLGITAFVLAKTGVFVKQFKNVIEAELSKALNREVTVEKIEGGVFDSIDLIKVRIAAKKEIKDGILIEIDKVSIKYSFKDIVFNKKEVIESLKGIELIRPSVLMEKDENGAWNIVDFISSLPVVEKTPLPKNLTISISKGLIVVQDSKKKFNSSLREIYGRVEFLEDGKLSIKAATKTYSSKTPNLFVDGMIDLKNKTNAVVVNGKDLDIAHYSSYVLAHLEKSPVSFTSGHFNLQANISDTYQVDVLIKNAAAKVEGVKAELSGIVGEINLDKDILTVKRIAMVVKGASITGKGEISKYLTAEPEGKLNIYVNRLELSEFNSEEFLKGLNPKGFLNAGIVLEGKITSPSVSVFANIKDLSLGGVRTDNNELVLRYKNKKATIESLKIFAFDGIAKLAGTYDFEKDSLVLAGEASEMQAGEIFNFAGVPGASGKATFTFDAKGPIKNITIASKAKIKKMSLVSGSLGEVTGDLLFFDNGKLRVNAISSEKLTMSTLFTFSNGKAATDGTIKLLGANFKNVYGFFVDNKMNLGGESNAQFTMKGPMEDITLAGDVLINNFNFEGYRAKTAKGNLKIKRGLLVGTGLIFNQDDKGYLKVDGSLGLVGDMILNIAVSASNVDFAGIPVFNNYFKMAGRGTFASKILGNISYPKFITTLSSEKMVLDNKQSFKVDLSFAYDNSILKVERCVLDNEYTFNGEFAFLKKTHIDSNFSAKQGKLETLFTFLKMPYKQGEVKGVLSGSVRLSGDIDDLSGEGDLNTENAVLFGKTINELAITFKVKEGLFTVSNFLYGSAGLEIGADGLISLKEKGDSSLNITMKNTFGKSVVNGNYTLTASGLFDPAKNLLSAKVKSTGLNLNGRSTGKIDGEINYEKSVKKFSCVGIRWEKLIGNVVYSGIDGTILADLAFDGTALSKIAAFDFDLAKTDIDGVVSGSMSFKLDNKGKMTCKTNKDDINIADLVMTDFKAKRVKLDAGLSEQQNGDFQVDIGSVLISQENGAIDSSGTILVRKGLPIGQSDCKLKISPLGVDIRNLLPLIKSKVDISAKLYSSTDISVSGKLENPVVTGLVKASDVRNGSMLLGDLSGELEYSDRKLNLKKVNYDNVALDNHAEFFKAVLIFKKDYTEAQLSGSMKLNKFLGLKLEGDFDTKNFKIMPGEKEKIDGELYVKNCKMNGYALNDISFRVFLAGDYLKKDLDKKKVLENRIAKIVEKKQVLTEAEKDELGKIKAELADMKRDIFRFNNISDFRSGTSGIKGGIGLDDKATTEFENFELSLFDGTAGTVKIDGTLGDSSKMSIDVVNTNVKLLLKYFDMDLDMTGTVNHATALFKGDSILPSVKVERGSLSDVKLFGLSFSTVLGDLAVEGNNLYLANVEGVGREYKNGENKIIYKVNVDGSIPMDQEQEQNLHVVLKNTGLQPIMVTDWFEKVEGMMDADFTINGKLSYPVVSKGYFIIKDGSAVYPKGFINKVDKLRAKIILSDNKATIQYFMGEIEKSPIEAFGSIELKKFYPNKLDLQIRNTQTAEKKGFQFKIGSVMEKEGTMFVKGYDEKEFFKLTGEAPNFKMDGEIHVYDTRFFWPPNYKEGEDSPKVLKQMEWNLKVVMEENVWYYNSYCEAKLKSGSIMTSSGLGSDLTMRGKAEIERGYFSFYTGKFDIKTASFAFLETEKRQPTIKAFCEFNTGTHKIFLEIRGKNGAMAELGTGNFDPVLTSQPEESQPEIIRILGGRASTDPLGELQRALISALGQQVTRAASDILPKNLTLVFEPLTGVKRTSVGDLTLNNEKTTDILDNISVGLQQSISENMIFKYTVSKQTSVDFNNVTSVLVPQIDVRLIYGNRNITFGVNPGEVKIGIGYIMKFDNEESFDNRKRKEK